MAHKRLHTAVIQLCRDQNINSAGSAEDTSVGQTWVQVPLKPLTRLWNVISWNASVSAANLRLQSRTDETHTAARTRSHASCPMRSRRSEYLSRNKSRKHETSVRSSVWGHNSSFPCFCDHQCANIQHYSSSQQFKFTVRPRSWRIMKLIIRCKIPVI